MDVSSGVVRFGIFEVDLRAGELRKRGVRVRLQEQPFQVLAYLLERRGEVVTREELQARLWTADTFVDFDHGLNSAMNKLREGLGDTADNPRFIETVPRRGYRFIAPVEVAAAATRPAPSLVPASAQDALPPSTSDVAVPPHGPPIPAAASAAAATVAAAASGSATASPAPVAAPTTGGAAKGSGVAPWASGPQATLPSAPRSSRRGLIVSLIASGLLVLVALTAVVLYLSLIHI